eukprot:gene432-776_t
MTPKNLFKTFILCFLFYCLNSAPQFINIIGIIASRFTDQGQKSTTNTIAQALSTTVSGGKGVKALSAQVMMKYLERLECRVNPVDVYAGRVIVRFIKDHYGWQNVNDFSTADTYGTDISLEFRNERMNQGINIENSYNFFPGTKDFSDLINTVKTRGVLKVFVFLMKASDAGALLEQGYNAGLFVEGTQTFGTRYMYTTNLFQYMSPKAPVSDIMNGVLGLDSPFLNKTHDGYHGFVKRFISQNSTKIINNDGSVECSDIKHDDGGTYLYQLALTRDVADCTGLVYSIFATDGSDIALAIALDHLLYKLGNESFSANDRRDAIRSKVSFLGASGLVHFNNGRPKEEGYGL